MIHYVGSIVFYVFLWIDFIRLRFPLYAMLSFLIFFTIWYTLSFTDLVLTYSYNSHAISFILLISRAACVGLAPSKVKSTRKMSQPDNILKTPFSFLRIILIIFLDSIYKWPLFYPKIYYAFSLD